MESQKIYEESNIELIKVRKALLSSDKVSIDFSKLDGESSRVLREKLSEGLSERIRTVGNIITTVQ